jgi:hypothetical protein
MHGRLCIPVLRFLPILHDVWRSLRVGVGSYSELNLAHPHYYDGTTKGLSLGTLVGVRALEKAQCMSLRLSLTDIALTPDFWCRNCFPFLKYRESRAELDAGKWTVDRNLLRFLNTLLPQL